LEIRAGTGGEEASLFAADLARMYQKYALEKGWKFIPLEASHSDLGGYKTFIAEVRGENAYNYLKFESGVHRVQRVPATEKSGRVHTSTASVAVLPQVNQSEVAINPSDLEVSFFRSSGPGGQNVNKVETAVRIKHIPTGIIVSSQVERSQARNREKALNILRAKIYEERQRQRESQAGSLRREQIGSSERAEKIRTYNFPQNRVTDHRLNKKWQKLDKIMEGNLDIIFQEALKNKKIEL